MTTNRSPKDASTRYSPLLVQYAVRRVLLPMSLVFVFTHFCGSPIHAQPAKSASEFMTEAGHVEFLSNVPLHSFVGQSDRLTGRVSLADSTVDFFVDLGTLRTGNGKRDKDMRKTLNTEDYPFAEFFGKLISPFDPSISQAQPASVEGVFKIHGHEKRMRIDGELRMADGTLTVSAKWDVSLDDFDINPPRLLIMKVEDVQHVSISATLHPVNEEHQ
ncbi:MAG: YceI family protein [Bacteroidetes bacterium]|nr:YceI family protein [Bacteroidota bacterium]